METDALDQLSQLIATKSDNRLKSSSTAELRHLSFSELYQHYIQFLLSPEYDKYYPPFITKKHEKQNF